MLYNLVAAVVIAMASGFSFLAIFAVGFLLSGFMQVGGLQMAIQKEIWMSSIVEGLFANNSFLSKAFSADEFVTQGKTVHIPNAGAPSGVVKNRSSFPATVAQRTDIDLYFVLDNYSTNPIKIDLAESVELSYSKRESVIAMDRAALINTISEAVLFSWLPASANTINTTGGSGAVTAAAHTPSATGTRKVLDIADVRKAMTLFNKQNIPQEGRTLLIDADMYDQLISTMTTQQAMAFYGQADVANGVVGKLFSFNIMMRSRVGVYATGGTPKDWETAGAATDNACALAFHANSVCRALGQVVVREDPNSAIYYGDIYSFEVRAGGRPMRNDVAGLLGILQS